MAVGKYYLFGTHTDLVISYHGNLFPSLTYLSRFRKTSSVDWKRFELLCAVPAFMWLPPLRAILFGTVLKGNRTPHPIHRDAGIEPATLAIQSCQEAVASSSPNWI